MKTIENELIPVYENDEGNKLVNARELFEFLRGSNTTTKFTDWISEKIKKYSFMEDIDFTSFSQKNEKGGRPSTEYILTLDTAKEMAMVENNENGKQARKYFIAVEKKYKSLNTQSFNPPQQIPALNTMNVVKFIADDLRVSKVSRIKMYRQACEDEGIKSNFLPTYTDEEVAKSATTLLKKFDIPMTAKKFNKLMIENGLMVEESRGNSKGGTKKYKSLTNAGLKYGINKVSSYGTEKETNALYHESTFMELINFLDSSEGVM